MKCALCLVEKETLPVKLNLATIHGPKDEMFDICKECLDSAHQAYIDKDFLAVKAGNRRKPARRPRGASLICRFDLRESMPTVVLDEQKARALFTSCEKE